MSPIVRPGRVPTKTAKLGTDTIALLRAVLAGARWPRHYTLDGAIWLLVEDLAAARNGTPLQISDGVPLDRAVYRSPPAKSGVPDGRDA